MAKFPTYEEMAKNVAEKALDNFEYQGKTIREWMKIITEQEPVLDKIRAEIEKKYPSCQCTGESTGYAEAVEDFLQIIDKYEEPKTKGRSLDADELLKRIAEKCKIPSLSADTVNGLCGATAIIYDMLNESEV